MYEMPQDLRRRISENKESSENCKIPTLLDFVNWSQYIESLWSLGPGIQGTRFSF